MFSSAILLLAVALSAEAVPGYDGYPRGQASWNTLMSRLMAVTPQNSGAETGQCGDHCYIVIGGEGHILNLKEKHADPANPCELYVCESGGVTRQKFQCDEVDSLEPCGNGKPPVRLPEQCCAACGGPSGPPDTFTMWGEWTTCSRTCGGGARARRRECVQTENGDYIECTGETLQDQPCNTDPCPVHCVWEEWSDWGTCSKTCEGGVSERRRGKNPEEMHGGRPCVGPSVDTTPCNEGVTCVVNCEWEWKTLNECKDDCDTRVRVPVITQHPEGNGKACPLSVINGEEERTPCFTPYGRGLGDYNDQDGDGIINVCDNCIYAANPGQENKDKDEAGDECDGDFDNDGVVNAYDNCPYIANPRQSTRDPARYGEKCTKQDYDDDGIIDDRDNCPYVSNPDQDSGDPKKYGKKCYKQESFVATTMDETSHSDKKGLAAEIMKMLLNTYYDN